MTPGISTTPVGNRQFLGQFGNTTATLSLADLPAHDSVTVSFDVYVLRSWDGNHPTWGGTGTPKRGDRFAFAADGVTRLDTTFRNWRTYLPGDATLMQEYAPTGTAPAGFTPSGVPLFDARTGAAEVNTLGYTFSVDGETLPADNRGTTGDLKSFTLKTDDNGVAVGTVKLSRQPGDNFRVVATLDKDLNLETGVVVKQKDATAGVYMAGGDAVAAKSATTVASEPITVWRHLWIEQDHMAAPPEGEVFDDTEPRKDVKPDGALADPKLDMAIKYFRRAYVEVAAVTTLNTRKESKWVHNIGGSEYPAKLKDFVEQTKKYFPQVQEVMASSRDVHGTSHFWTIQVVGAYEAGVFEDQDPHSGAPTDELLADYPDTWVLGFSRYAGDTPKDSGALIYMETIRDAVDAGALQTFKWNAQTRKWEPQESKTIAVRVATVDELSQRVAYHELLHSFDLKHSDDKANTGVFDSKVLVSGNEDAIALSDYQISKVRATVQPNGE